jgi:hypothetical protein
MTDAKQAELAVRRTWNTYFTRREQLIGGTVDALFAAGGPALFKWLSKQTPEGATISETLAAIAVDAMNEETDQ